VNYTVKIGKNEYQIKVHHNRVVVNGEPVSSRLIRLNNNGLYLLRHDDRDVEVHIQEKEAGALEVVIAGQRVVAHVDTPQRRERRKKEGPQAGTVVAPMPGLVVSVNVKEGEDVQQGQVLAVLESMKMQMQMRAPIEGRVTRVPTRNGAQVEKGALLVQIE